MGLAYTDQTVRCLQLGKLIALMHCQKELFFCH